MECYQEPHVERIVIPSIFKISIRIRSPLALTLRFDSTPRSTCKSKYKQIILIKLLILFYVNFQPTCMLTISIKYFKPKSKHNI